MINAEGAFLTVYSLYLKLDVVIKVGFSFIRSRMEIWHDRSTLGAHGFFLVVVYFRICINPVKSAATPTPAKTIFRMKKNHPIFLWESGTGN